MMPCFQDVFFSFIIYEIQTSTVLSDLLCLTLQHIDLSSVNLLLVDLELTLKAFVAHRVKRLQTPRKLIEEIDSQPESTPRCPSGKIKINVRLSNQARRSPPTAQQQHQQHAQTKLKNLAGVLPTPRVGTSPLIKSLNTSQAGPGQGESNTILYYVLYRIINFNALVAN